MQSLAIEDVGAVMKTSARVGRVASGGDGDQQVASGERLLTLNLFFLGFVRWWWSLFIIQMVVTS